MSEVERRIADFLREEADTMALSNRTYERMLHRAKVRRAVTAAAAGLAVIAIGIAGVITAETLGRPSSTGPAAPAESPAPGAQGRAWETDRAASFAVRAIAHAGLLDPTGELYSYTRIREAQGKWTVTFDIWDCSQSVELGRCLDPSSSARLTVSIEEGRLIVAEAVGPMDDGSLDRLAQYREVFEPEVARFEFPYVEVTQFKGGSAGLQGSPLWTGPIPYVGQAGADEIGNCQAEVRNSSGKVVYRGSAGGGEFVPLTVPRTEEMRSGGLSGVPIPAAMARKSQRVRIICGVGDAASLGP